MNQKEVKTICKLYNLGTCKSIKLLTWGLVNNNFDIETNKGNFIIRILGHGFAEWKKQKLQLEFKVLNYLTKKNFPYEIPVPIKNLKNNYVLTINKKNLWVYKKLNGRSIKQINPKKFKEVVKVLALYDKYIQGFKVKYNKQFYDLSWLLSKYNSMKKVEPKNKLDKIMLKDVNLYDKWLRHIMKITFPGKMIATHSDVMPSNLLFRGDKITALLDFENIEIAPRIKDVANTIERICIDKHNLDKKKMRLFLKEYEKINPLTKKEKEAIIPLLIRDYCIGYWWFYAEMNKRKDLKEKILKRITKRMKDLVLIYEKLKLIKKTKIFPQDYEKKIIQIKNKEKIIKEIKPKKLSPSTRILLGVDK